MNTSSDFYNHNVNELQQDGSFAYGQYQDYLQDQSLQGHVQDWSTINDWQQQPMHVASNDSFQHQQQINAPQASYQQEYATINPATYSQGFHAYPNTVAPNALAIDHSQHRPTQNASPIPERPTPNPQQALSSERPQSTATAISSVPHYVDQSALVGAVPRGQGDGLFLLVDQDALSASTKSKPINNFVNVGLQAFEFPVNRSTLPIPIVRRSRNQLYELARNNPALKDKLSKKTHKSESKANAALKAKFKYASATNAAATLADDMSDYSSSDEYSSDYESDDEPLKTSPLPNVRPGGVLQATEYDAIKAVWRARRNVDFDDVKKALVDFWDVVRAVRDQWKTRQTVLTQAEEKAMHDEIPNLRSLVKDQRDVMVTVCKAALTHGHPRILEHLSENNSLLFVCYQYLLDRHKEADMSSELVVSILKLLTCCHTLTTEKLDKTHLNKLLPRYAKKGSPDVQALVNSIEKAAKEGSARAKAEASTAATSTRGVGTTPTIPVSPVEGQGVKRPAPNSTTQQTMAKKPMNASTIASQGTKPVSRPATAASPVARPGSAGTNIGAKAAAGPTGVTKVKTTTTKPSPFFSTVQSATKKAAPATTTTPKTSVVAAALKKAEGKPIPKSMPAAGAKSTGFDDLLAGLTSEAEKPKAPKAQKQVETEEEKAKRLRKEARRTLRVTFKPDSVLEEVRYFTHDPEEEVEHNTSSMRDLSDVGGEGRMLKQHNDMVEFEDDDDPTGQDDLRDYYTPSEVDFSPIEAEERQRLYQKFGGGLLSVKSPETAARSAQDIAALFNSLQGDDRSSPEEPTTEQATENSTIEFGAPTEVTMHRAKQISGPSVSSTGDEHAFVSALLGVLQPQAQPQVPTPAPAPAQSAPPSINLQDLMAQLESSGQSLPQSLPTSANQVAPDLISSLLSSLQPGINGGSALPIMPHDQQPSQPHFTAAMLSSMNPNMDLQQQGQNQHYSSGQDRGDHPPPQKKQRHKGNFKQRPCKYYQEGR